MPASRRHLALSSVFGFAVPASVFGLAALAIGGGDAAFAQIAPSGVQPLLIEREPPGATKPMFAPPVLVPPGASGGVPMPSGPAVPPQAIHIPAPAAPVAVPAAPPVTIIQAPIAAPTSSSSVAVPPEPKSEPMPVPKPEPKPVTPPAEAAPVSPPAASVPAPAPTQSDAVAPPAPVPAPAAPAAGPVPAPAPADATPAPAPAPAVTPPVAEPAKPAPTDVPPATPVAPGAPGAAVVPPAPPAGEAPASVSPPPATAQLVPVEVEVAARPVIFVTGVTTWEKAEEKLDGVFVTLAAAAKKLGVQPAGAPLVEYIESDSDDIGYRAMIPVETAPKGKLPKGVKVGQSTGGKALKFRHAGPLDDLEEVYGRIDDELAKRNLDTRALVEEYDVDALASPEDRVVMDIYVFLK